MPFDRCQGSKDCSWFGCWSAFCHYYDDCCHSCANVAVVSLPQPMMFLRSPCTAWEQHCDVGSGTTKAVLAYLADRTSEDGIGAYSKVKTIYEVTEFSERSVRFALKLLEFRGFIRPGDLRHAAIAKNGRTKPKQYRATVWDLCVDQDLQVPNYLIWTNHDDDEKPESTHCANPRIRVKMKPKTGVQ